MVALYFTVTIHGQALYEHAAPDFGTHSAHDEGSPSDQPYGLLSDAIAAVEKAVATGAFHYNQMALGFISERIFVHDITGSLLFSALVKDAVVQWTPFTADSVTLHISNP